MHVANYLALLHNSEKQLADALMRVAEHHSDEPDVYANCKLLASWSQDHMQALGPLRDPEGTREAARYQEHKSEQPERLCKTLFEEPRTGSLALLRDLHDLWLLANEVHLCWIVLSQAAKALHDKELLAACENLGGQTRRQIAWLLTRIKQAAPQILVVAA